MSVLITTIVDEAKIDLIGCPDPLILRATREVLQEFCGSTWIINRAIYAAADEVVDASYDLENYEVCSLFRLVIDGIEYKAKRREAVTDEDEMDDIEESDAKFWYPGTGGVITIMPFDTAPTTIRCRVAFKPTMLATYVEDAFYNDWHDTIVYGVKGRLLNMPKKAWTDKAGARDNRLDYLRGKGSALRAVRRQLDVNEYTRDSFHL